jgi:hypothetical protein
MHGLWVGQQVLASTYSIFKMYLRGEGSLQGPSEPAGRGKSPKVQETPCANCGLGNRCQQSTYSICKTYLHGEGRHGVLASLRGGGGVQGPNEPMDAARGLWVRKQASAKRIQNL